MTELDLLREKIDGIDHKIVRLLEDRMELSLRVGEYKAANSLPVLDAEREKDATKMRTAILKDKKLEGAVTEIFNLIMRLSRERQEGRK